MLCESDLIKLDQHHINLLTICKFAIKRPEVEDIYIKTLKPLFRSAQINQLFGTCVT